MSGTGGDSKNEGDRTNPLPLHRMYVGEPARSTWGTVRQVRALVFLLIVALAVFGAMIITRM